MNLLFQDKLLVDDRVPLWSFDLQGVSGRDDIVRIEFLPPKPTFIFQVLVIITIQILLAHLLSLFAYYGILRTTTASTNKLLVGFGFIIPLALFSPFYLADSLDIRASCLRMGLCALPLTVVFRTLQAMCGFTPKAQTATLYDFQCHFAFFYHPKLDPNNNHATPLSVDASYGRTILVRYMLWNISMAAIYSCLVSIDSFEPFPTKRASHELHVALGDAGHLANNFLAAVILSMSLSLSMNGIAPLVALLGGFQCEPIMDHPMFQSASPSDFWGRRWNRMVHADLKNGVYLPVRSFTSSRQLATLATFLASGLIHEYVWYVLFYCNRHQQLARTEECYEPQYGKNLLFFLWNGCLLLLEYAVAVRDNGDDTLWSAMIRKRVHTAAKQLPKPIVSLGVVAMALPVGHFLTGDLIAGGYIPQLRVAFPLLIVSKGV